MIHQVSPDLYGDNNTRLFTYWTSDAYQATGCYNMLCSGFIQINSEVAMGASIFPLSGYSGNQYDISLLIWKVREHFNIVLLEMQARKSLPTWCCALYSCTLTEL